MQLASTNTHGDNCGDRPRTHAQVLVLNRPERADEVKSTHIGLGGIVCVCDASSSLPFDPRTVSVSTQSRQSLPTYNFILQKPQQTLTAQAQE